MPAMSPGAAAAPPVGKFRPLPQAWLQARLGLDPGDPLLDGAPSSALLLDRLEQADRIEAALCLAAHALPPREAVWWACMCARHTAAGDAPPRSSPHSALQSSAQSSPDQLAGDAAEAWVRQPDEMARALAFRAARAARFKSAEALAALAVFWAAVPPGFSIPADTATGQLGGSVERAVRLSALRGSMPERPVRWASFLRSARDIAGGGAGQIAPAVVAAAPSAPPERKAV